MKYAIKYFIFINPLSQLNTATFNFLKGYFFFFQPIQLYLDGEKKQAVNLFLKTLAAFAGITVLFLLTLFSRILF